MEKQDMSGKQSDKYLAKIYNAVISAKLIKSPSGCARVQKEDSL